MIPWGLVFIERVGLSSVLTLVRTETVDRAVAGTAHVQPWWFYIAVSALAFLPWAGPLALGLGRACGRWRDPDSPTGPYAAAAFVAGLVFFSLSKGKLPNYILPLAPLAALVVTFELGQELIHPSHRRTGPALVATTLIALAVGLGVAASIKLEDRAQGLAYLGAVAFGAAGVGALYGILKTAPRIVYAAAAAASTVFLLGVVFGAPRLVAEARSAAPLVAAVPALQSARPLVLVDMNLPSLTYYTDRVAEKVSGSALPARLARGDEPLVVLDAADWASLPPAVRGRLRELGRSGKLRALDTRPGSAP